MKPSLEIDIPDHFSFRATVYSHGWSELAPFVLDEENWRLGYVFTDGTVPLPGVIFEKDGKLQVELEREPQDASRILADVRHLLRLDDDLSDFYSLISADERMAWISHNRAGRLVRSPTVWEDLVKTMCTTNCSWGLTKIMVRNLVDKLGLGGAFPTVESMASVDEAFFRQEIRAGYRSPFFVELAQRALTGELDPQAWLVSELSTPELKKEIKRVKGVGDYAADNLLKLVGRYDGLALDSFLRGQFYKTHNRERACPDKKIERHYKKYGQWRGLVIWCDMTERWIGKTAL